MKKKGGTVATPAQNTIPNNPALYSTSKTLVRFNFEILAISLVGKATTCSLPSLFCTVSIGEHSKTIQSMTYESKGSSSRYLFDHKTSALEDLLTYSGSTFLLKLTVCTDSSLKTILGEATTTFFAASVDSEKELKLPILKKKENVGELTYRVVRVEESFFEDSASEYSQLSASPSPFVVRSMGRDLFLSGSRPPAKQDNKDEHKPFSELDDYNLIGRPPMSPDVLSMDSDGVDILTPMRSPAPSSHSPVDSDQSVQMPTWKIVMGGMLLFLSGFVVALLIPQSNRLISLQSKEISPLTPHTTGLTLTRFGSKKTLLLLTNQTVYAQWRIAVTGTTITAHSLCLGWQPGAFMGGKIVLKACSDRESLWKIRRGGDDNKSIVIEHMLSSKCLGSRNSDPHSAVPTLLPCSNLPLWTFFDQSLSPTSTHPVSPAATRLCKDAQQNVMFRPKEDTSSTTSLILDLNIQTVAPARNSNAEDDFDVSEEELWWQIEDNRFQSVRFTSPSTSTTLLLASGDSL
eukprot:scaffold620_cov177-Ochromonas_danica.AAC.20